jgi:Uma2 family endonuclease
MTFEEFLDWDDGTRTRYEFIGGRPVAMAPARARHGAVEQNVGTVLGNALDRMPGCTVVHQAGVRAEVDGDKRFYVADVALTCENIDEQVFLEAPRLIVEVLSPSTGNYDEAYKVPDHCALPTVEEVWLIDSRSRWVMVWQRAEDRWIGSVPYRGAQTFRSRVLDTDVALDALYRNIRFKPPAAEPPGEPDAAGEA